MNFKIECSILLIIITLIVQNTRAQQLYINEFMALNDNNIVDEFGENNDWIEIYNAGYEAIDIGGMYITDYLSDPGLWQIPLTNSALTTIQPGNFLILWADKEFEQGILHLEIKLSGNGEQIGLSKKVDNEFIYIDSLSFPVQFADKSYGRYPDASNQMEYFDNPTPGSTNSGSKIFELINTKENILLFPNPSKGIFMLEYNNINHFNITIYSEGGIIVYRRNNLITSTNIDVSHLNNGFYFLIMNSIESGFITVKKIIIEY